MKLKALGLTALAVSVAALVAACGGGGGNDAALSSGVQVSGVAATGLALASAPVEVKCASGTGTATTNESGGYTVTVENGALPCIVKVTGTVNGTAVTLHSLAQGSGSSATANVTPLTEMILARATGTLPADLFSSFGSGSAVTSTALTQATTEVLAALSTAAGVDLTRIDPFGASLVAATSANPTGGNDYDKLLDQLGAVVSTATLPQVVSQIASTGGSSAPVTLEEVVANVSKGTLAGCPQALSGKYRIVDYIGATDVIDIDFGAKIVKAPDGEHAISPSTVGQACEFNVAGSFPTTVVIGPSGAGVTRDDERVGFIFPVQAHAATAAQGKWEFMESGLNEANAGEHWVGEMDIAADGTIKVCDYAVMSNDFSSCVVDTEEAASIAAQSDGSFVLNYGASVSNVYGFRAPNGSLTLFGTNNPGGNTSSGVLKTSFVLTKPQTVTAPAVGSTSTFWDIVQFFSTTASSPTAPVLNSGALGRNSTTITAATETSMTRKLTSSGSDNGRIDTLQLNQPIPGMRFRAAGTDPSGIGYSTVYIRNLPGLGISMALDGMPSRHFASYIVNRP